MAELVLRTLTLTALGALSVSIWTLRVALAARGRRTAAALTAGLDAVVFAVVFASVLSSMDSPLEVAGYAVGVSAGTLLGVFADARLSTGKTAAHIVVDGDGEQLAVDLSRLGWPATRLPARGLDGAATLLMVVVDDTRVPRLLADLAAHAPDALWTMERLQTAHPAPLPAGYRQVHVPSHTILVPHDVAGRVRHALASARANPIPEGTACRP